MTWNRWARRVDATQADIVAALRGSGVKVFIVGRPWDLLCWSDGRFWFCECKSDGGTLTHAQKGFIAEFEDEAAVPVYFAKTPVEALAAAAEAGQWR